MSHACRIALHLQLASTSFSDEEQQDRADAQALPSAARDAGSIQTRQSSAERDLYAEQQRAAAASASISTQSATAAEAAVISSCVVSEKLLHQLQGLLPSATAGLMVRT